MSIGKNIAKYRKAKGLTQEELGTILGVTNQAVSKWESEVSMPDVMLLPEIATALNMTLEDLYGIAKEPEKISCSADDFPAFCHQKLIELFYYNTKMRFTHIGSSDKEQLDFQIKKLMEGCRIGCLSNTQGAIVAAEDFCFIDSAYKATGSEKVIKGQTDDYTLMYLTDKNLRKVFYYQYKTAFEKSKSDNTEFTFDEIMAGCNLTEDETAAALRLLKDTGINDVYTDTATKTKKYVFLISNALYAHAIYRLAELLSEDACWAVVRDTSMISDYAFGK
ncbi:MAG: helix-turn-helix domain-containing protein [Ruminococcaceae bacterium]|nr:helix-turn-helix domain-containing protein [Oscillospiraceae bacterium]